MMGVVVLVLVLVLVPSMVGDGAAAPCSDLGLRYFCRLQSGAKIIYKPPC